MEVPSVTGNVVPPVPPVVIVTGGGGRPYPIPIYPRRDEQRTRRNRILNLFQRLARAQEEQRKKRKRRLLLDDEEVLLILMGEDN